MFFFIVVVVFISIYLFFFVTEEEIDGKAFTLMTIDDIKKVCPKLGPQLKLINLHKQLLASLQNTDKCVTAIADCQVSACYRILHVVTHFKVCIVVIKILFIYIL